MTSSEPTMGDTTAEELLPDFGRHNMFVFGRDTVFLSHLPMFMEPHDAQLILQVTLGEAGGSFQEIWSKERASHPDERLYTMMPEQFPLSTLYDEDPPRRGSFRGRFFRGHLERGGVVVPGLSNVDIHITDVVYARRFGGISKPDDLGYLLVGKGRELFLAHVISEPPDFDQIVSVRIEEPEFDEGDVKAGLSVVFPGRANTAATRLQDGTTATARGHVIGAHRFLELELADIEELYFEEGELVSPDADFEPTRLEIEAGFGD